ncbi:MAG: V-type ATP synthase subunit K [Candidatus Thorarchaeota archaeon]
MKLDNRITSLVMLLIGVVLLTLALTMANALIAAKAPAGPGFILAQVTDGAGMAILGLAIGAGLALGLAGVGAAIGMGTASAAALGAITEKPETFGKSILYVVFIEAVAIYGFVIAFLLVGLMQTLIG